MGLDFLFIAGLFALPLAGLPVLLHMLFRRKSPVVPFSTLRFVRSSVQQTAARRRVQRWVLLSCRILLLALLILAISQPVRIVASSWLAASSSSVAAIVVDSSYSMQLRQNEVLLLDRAGDSVLRLLRGPLADAQVVVFRSQSDPPDRPEQLRPAAQVLAEWVPLRPEPAVQPLTERCASAIAFLDRQPAAQKWLIIVSDLQSREFPHPLPQLENTRLVLIDLHPDQPNSSGIASIRVEPEQPIPGVGTQLEVQVAGRGGEVPFFDLTMEKMDGQSVGSRGNLGASIEATGRALVQVNMNEGLPAERWLLLKAKLHRDDDLPWDNQRSILVELPPRQEVTLIADVTLNCVPFLTLALDPWEGGLASWPLRVTAASALTGKEDAAVIALSDWPSERVAAQLRMFVESGGTLVLLLQPGLEQTWQALPTSHQKAMAVLLPGAPMVVADGGAGKRRPTVPARADPILQNLLDPSFQLDRLEVRRFVPMGDPADASVTQLLPLSSDTAGREDHALLYGRAIGSGRVYTFATLPDGRYLSPPVHPVLLPMLVNMCLRPAEQRDAQNVEIGQPLTLSGQRFGAYSQLEIEDPPGQRYRVVADDSGAAARFRFDRTASPGVYRWFAPGEPEPIALANVQLPAEESDLLYKPADAVIVPSAEALVVRSVDELQSQLARLSEPRPQWTWPIAVVLGLICLEALLASGRTSSRTVHSRDLPAVRSAG